MHFKSLSLCTFSIELSALKNIEGLGQYFMIVILHRNKIDKFKIALQKV